MNERDQEGSARYENAFYLEPEKRLALMVLQWRLGFMQVRNTSV